MAALNIQTSNFTKTNSHEWGNANVCNSCYKPAVHADEKRLKEYVCFVLTLISPHSASMTWPAPMPCKFTAVRRYLYGHLQNTDHTKHLHVDHKTKNTVDEPRAGKETY